MVESSPASLSGLRVFIVEDEFPILLLIEDMLTSLGCSIVGTASSVSHALDGADNDAIDLAVLDINVAGEKIYPVAVRLQDREMPIVFSTGYGAAGIEPEWSHCPVVQKPFVKEQLAQALRQALRGRLSGC